MKRGKPLPIPQKEFAFTPNAFNLIREWTADGERLASEREQAEQARLRTDAAQPQLLQPER